MDREKIREFAKNHGYEDVIYEGEWRGCSVYGRVFKGEEPRCLGYPLKILVKDDEIRLSTTKETREYILYAYADKIEQDDTIEF